MLIEAQDIMAPYVEILNLDNGLVIENCLRVNLETGEYEVFVNDSVYGEFTGIFKLEKRKGNLVLVYKGGDDFPVGVSL